MLRDDPVLNCLSISQDGLFHEEIGDHDHAVEMPRREVPVELALPLIFALVVVLNSSDDFSEELQCCLDAFFVIFDHFGDLVEEVPELLLTVKTLYRQTNHMVK